VAGSPLIGLLCLAARLASLWGRVSAFLEKLLIGRAEGKFLPAVAARNLHISGHRSPMSGIVQPKPCFFRKESLGLVKVRQKAAFRWARGLAVPNPNYSSREPSVFSGLAALRVAPPS